LLIAQAATHRPVEKYRVDIVVGDRRVFAAGGHAQRTQEDRYESRQLFDVFLLALNQAEYDRIPLSHALRVIGPDVQFNDLLPASTTQPPAKETLHLLDKSINYRSPLLNTLVRHDEN
jgi:hypothetical protein